MRYYVYLDRDFIRSLFASINASDFDIEVVEYSVQQGQSTSNDLNVSPRIEKSNEMYKEGKAEESRRNDCRKRKETTLNVFTGERNTYTTTVERKYINIEDVSQIKNIAFFDKLVRKLEAESNNPNNLCIEKGYIYPCKIRNRFQRDINMQNNDFFCINGKYIWLNNLMLETDLLVLSTILSNVTVIGLCINNPCENKVIKAIAIYVE